MGLMLLYHQLHLPMRISASPYRSRDFLKIQYDMGGDGSQLGDEW
jgi:hypothetical protein